MRKVKAAAGAWAVWAYDLYPYLLCGQIGDHPNAPDRVPAVKKGARGQDVVYVPSYQAHFTPLFCVSAEDGPVVKAEIDRLRAKDRQSDEVRRRLMADIRKRSLLGQLNPREEK